MSEKTAIRTAVTLAAAAACWAASAWWLSRTSVPSLHLSGLDEHRYFSERGLRRTERFARGEDLLWLGGPLSTTLAIVVLVGLAGRFRSWWALAAAIFVGIAALFAFTSGWIGAAGTHALRDPVLAGDVQRLERIEHVPGTPVRVQDVSSWTNQAN